ncbi:MAG: DEAD/DEAH box helicase family protein [Saprospiraceae bacterium]
MTYKQLDWFLESSDWLDFMVRMDAASKKEAGDLFELLCVYYLKWNEVHSSNYQEVWLHKDVPDDVRRHCKIPSRDAGLDAYALTVDGRYIGIQCKYVSNTKGSLSRDVFSTSVDQAFTQCRNISGLVLMTTKERLTEALERYHVQVTGIKLDSWLELNGEALLRFKAFIRGDIERSRPNPYAPRPHQLKAIENARKHFLTEDRSRGKLIHPCGAGKSLTGFWLAQELHARSVVVAVPSLTLVRQTYKTWLREFKAHDEEVEWIAVCSDKTVGKLSQSEQDDVVTSLLELGIESHTDPEFIAEWLSKENGRKKVVFTTYQSGQALADGVQRAGFTFELGIFDEAHKTVGQSTKLFSHLLFDENIPVRKRIYMTATERVFRGSSDEILSMDDPDIYGETFEFFSFKQAIESDPPVLTDYKVLVLAVTQAEIRQYIEDNVLIRTKGVRWDEDVEASMLASLIALNKAHEKYDIRHTVSFHSSIAKAVAFKENQERLNQLGRFSEMATYHVTGKTSTSDRNREIEAFAINENALITNARCLTEGVDVPTIDCVLFADPRQSKIDIVQAIGRALRVSKGKQIGYVLLPLIIGSEDIETVANEAGYGNIVAVLRALATQDSRIVEELKELARGKERNLSILEVDLGIKGLESMSIDSLLNEIGIRSWNSIRSLNWRSFDEARLFVRGLGLKSGAYWKKYCESGEKPFDIPSKPNDVYKNLGWRGMGDWLGTDRTAFQLIDYQPYPVAEQFVHSLSLNSVNEWREYCDSGEKPEDIPTVPHNTYNGKGWVDYGQWLGTNRASNWKKEWRSFEEARAFVHTLGLQSRKEWDKYCKSGAKPKDIPQNPVSAYKDQGWKGVGDWLGTGTLRTSDIQWREFEDARQFVRGLGLNSNKEWRAYCKSGKKPTDIPTQPDRAYKALGWVSYGDWLGTRRIASNQIHFLPFVEARRFVQSLSLKNVKDWREYCHSGQKPDIIPAKPYRTYKDSGWTGMGDWLGTGNIAPKDRSFLEFTKAREFVRTLGLRSTTEWRKYSESGNRPDNIPSAPSRTYKNAGWISWKDWLGN